MAAAPAPSRDFTHAGPARSQNHGPPEGLEFSMIDAICNPVFPIKHTMQKLTAKLLLTLVACTLVVPESYAKRLGGGRSFGRQAQVARQRTAPPPVVRPRPALPPVAQPRVVRPPYVGPAPAQVQRRSGSPLGGMFGGALLGLGLGSVLGSSHAQAVAEQEAARQEAARQEAARQESARLEAEKRQQEQAAGASAQGDTSAGAGETPSAPAASGNW